MTRLNLSDLPNYLDEPVMTSMNFLNEAVGKYPDAISLASGRPHDFFLTEIDIPEALDRYKAYLRDELGLDPAGINRRLYQYGPARGIINEVVARMLRTDEDIVVPAEAIVMTVGCQEAIYLSLQALCHRPGDVAFIADPGYLGLLGAARLLNVKVRVVPENDSGLDLRALAEAVSAARAEGLRPRVVYVIPDFANPSGHVMSQVDREALLALAEREGLLILEDNPYGFTAANRVPTLKALDENANVVYLGTFAKVCLPGARVGYLIADQPVTDERDGSQHLLAEDLATLKSMITCNTAPIAQAVVAGVILGAGGTLVPFAKARAEFYQANLHALLHALEENFPKGEDWRGRVEWNRPSGGFFVMVRLPFELTADALDVSAGRFGVLWTPMSYFYADGGNDEIRLSASYSTPELIKEGVRRLAEFLAEQAVAHETRERQVSDEH